MSRSDLILNLAHAGMVGDRPSLRRTVMALAEEAKAKQQHTLAKRFSSMIEDREMPSNSRFDRSIVPDQVKGLLQQITPRRRFDDLLLPPTVRNDVRDLVEEYSKIDLLRSYSLEPRHTMLLIGPPGTGKTSLAEAIATELGLVLFVVRYEAIIGSYLGETAGKLRDVLEFVSATPCVIFFDEFDALGKERGDIHETGEIKRVVNSLLMQLDQLPPHVFVVAATNHPELLDRAVWRRFEMHVELPLPTSRDIDLWFKVFANEVGIIDANILVGLNKQFSGVSFSDLEQFTLDVKRRFVLSDQKDWGKAIEATILRWRRRLLFASKLKKTNGSRTSNRTDQRGKTD